MPLRAMIWKRSRRRFLELLGSTATAATVGGCASTMAEPQPPPSPSADPTSDGMSPRPSAEPIPHRALGATGAKVSLLGLGGYHLGKPDEATAIRIMHRAIDEGITFFDNCWDYHAGESERRMGKALEGGRRDRVFLMSKIDGRTEDSAAEQIDDSLRRLRTDRIDLMQIHEVIRPKDPAWVFEEGGAIEALVRARDAGKIRFIGFTGHKSPSIHNAMIDQAEAHGFRFDTVQMPLNVMDPHYDSFRKEVLPRLVAAKIGVLGMKSLASGAILKTGLVDAPTCLRYALSLPTSVVITGCENERDLDQAIEVGRGFQPMSEAAIAALIDRTRKAGSDGDHEDFKTTDQFDATARNPRWLTSAEI